MSYDHLLIIWSADSSD